MFVYLSLFLSALCLIGANHNFSKTFKGFGKQRDGKFLPLFQVVKFPNDPCDAANNITGTCYTSDECSNKGGESSGICANGFGVCCVFKLSCGKTSSYNNTYLDSSKSTIGQSCSYKICPLSSSITRIKFDFQTFNIGDPYTTSTDTEKSGGAIGDCIIDSFSISAPGSVGTPVICGKNSGQHVIVSSSPLCNIVLFNFGSSTAAEPRSWIIRVIQYTIGSEDVSGSPDCLQYFYGDSGTISSFNLNGLAGTHLSNQHYTICFRRESGKCKLCLQQNSDKTFGLSTSKTETVYGVLNDGCSTDYLTIPGGMTQNKPAYRSCGRLFGDDTATTASSVCTSLTPFRITFRSDQDEIVDTMTANINLNEVHSTDSSTNSVPVAPGTLGFSLKYWQIGC